MLKPTTTSDGIKSERPQSPSSVAIGWKESKNVADATGELSETANIFFRNPLSNIPETIVPKSMCSKYMNVGYYYLYNCSYLLVFAFSQCQTELVIPQPSTETESCVAIHTRVGRDPVFDETFDDIDDDSDLSYFSPRVVSLPNSQLPDSFDVRQWSVIAQARNNTIQIWCCPLGWTEPEEVEDGFGGDEVDYSIPFYITAKLILPRDGVIRKIGFYSDDGKSSLSSGNDSGDGKEGRQKLSVVFQRETLELWLIRYEALHWQSEPFDSIFNENSNVIERCHHTVLPLSQSGGPEEDEMAVDDDGPTLFAQSKLCIRIEVIAF